MSFSWQKIGSIATPSEAGVLRFTSTNDSAGNISFSNEYYRGGYYRGFGFFYNQNTGTFSSTTDYSQTISELLSAFPISYSGNLAYRIQTPSTIFVKYLGTTYTLHTGVVGGVDANPELFIAYSFGGSGGSGKYLGYGKFFGSIQPGFGDLGSVIDTGLLGPVSISRNGLFVTVAGVPSGGTSINTIKVYTKRNGLPPNQTYFTAIQAGNTITIPETENISEVKINNAGTRLVAYTFSNIYTYELISGSWVERNSIASPASYSGTGISLSSAGDILVTRGNSVAVSYSWNDVLKSWQLVDETNILSPVEFPVYVGSKIDISEDAKYMAVDAWPTANSTSIEIYKRVGDIPTYEIPLYKGAYAQSVYYGSSVPNSIYYGTKRLFAS